MLYAVMRLLDFLKLYNEIEKKTQVILLAFVNRNPNDLRYCVFFLSVYLVNMIK